MTRRLSTKCGKAVVNSTTCGLKERGVASQKVQDGEAVLRENLVTKLGQKNMLGNIEWLGRRLGLKCIVIRRPGRRLGLNNIIRLLGQ